MRIPNEEGNLGKYDSLCETALLSTQAQCVAMLIVGGFRGNGFSVSTRDPNLLRTLPALLRATANNIEAQQKGASNS